MDKNFPPSFPSRETEDVSDFSRGHWRFEGRGEGRVVSTASSDCHIVARILTSSTEMMKRFSILKTEPKFEAFTLGSRLMRALGTDWVPSLRSQQKFGHRPTLSLGLGVGK